MADYNIPLKRCSVCENEYPATPQYFCRNKRKSDGLDYECKPCSHIRRNPEYCEQKIEREKLHNSGQKRCVKCGIVKPETGEHFNQRPDSRDGMRSCCKRCEYELQSKRHAEQMQNPEYAMRQRKYNQIYWEQNRGRMSGYSRMRRQNKPHETAAYQREYRDRNKEKLSQQKREYYILKKESMSRKARVYRQTNPQVFRASWHRYRARKLALPDTFTAQDWLRCLDYWHYCCPVCGRQLRDLFATHKPAADHWIALTDPRPDNPGTVPENIVPLCHGQDGCNNKKKDRDPETWLARHYKPAQVKAILARINAYFAWVKEQDKP